jgi:ketosteroid isomerase-like protein
METVLVIEDGDTTVAEWTWTASHTGSLAMPDGSEVPPTGTALVGAGVTIITVRDGKIASERDYFDSAAVMSQMTPMPGT